MHKILIVGGGAGGELTANALARLLKKEIAASEASITVIEKSAMQEFQPEYLHIAFEGENPKKIRRPTKALFTPFNMQVVAWER